MKSIHKLLLMVLTVNVFCQAPLFSINFSVIGKGISKGVEIAGHVATGVDVAMSVASVGVTLWGSDTDRERMAKGMQVTGLITSIAKGDFESAQTHAETIRGGADTQSQALYTPLSANELADADIVQVK